MTALDRNRRHANSALDAGAPSTHDPKEKLITLTLCIAKSHSNTVADRATTPDAFEQLLIGDELLRALCQRAEHRRCVRR